MKYKITEKEIKAIANGEANIKDLFPDVFEVKLEIGKVYKTNYVNEKGVKSKFMAYIQDVEKMENYGFSFNGDFDVNMYFSKENHNRLSEATQKEWEEALIKEAERRGLYSENKTFYSYDGGSAMLVNPKIDKIVFKNNTMLLWNIPIFKDGIWAEIIPTMTKKEAEEKLNCKIV